MYDGLGHTVSSDAARWNDLQNGLNGGEWTAKKPLAINRQNLKATAWTESPRSVRNTAS